MRYGSAAGDAIPSSISASTLQAATLHPVSAAALAAPRAIRIAKDIVGVEKGHLLGEPSVRREETAMALVVFLRGVNVGGHRTFRPSVVARELSSYDVVNVGAAGTFVVRKPGRSQTALRAELVRKLPAETDIMFVDGRDLLQLETENPFGPEPPGADIVRFISILSKAGAVRTPMPVSFPPEGEWLVRIIASKGQFVFGTYRRHMKTIAYLGKIDRLFDAPATTRNWNTIEAILRILRS